MPDYCQSLYPYITFLGNLCYFSDDWISHQMKRSKKVLLNPFLFVCIEDSENSFSTK